MPPRDLLLLVEDDHGTREILTVLLHAEGWAVHAVDSGESALAWLATLAAPLATALCDLHLPGICGPRLAHAMRASAHPPATLLAITATASTFAAEGYDAVLVKPFPASAVRAATVTAPESPVEAPILDRSTLEKLTESMGSPAARSLYAFALADTGDRLARMSLAITARDPQTYAAQAHSIKGSAGMVGARRLWQIAANAEMESLGEQAPQKIAEMHAETDAVRLMLETLFPV